MQLGKLELGFPSHLERLSTVHAPKRPSLKDQVEMLYGVVECSLDDPGKVEVIYDRAAVGDDQLLEREVEKIFARAADEGYFPMLSPAVLFTLTRLNQGSEQAEPVQLDRVALRSLVQRAQEDRRDALDQLDEGNITAARNSLVRLSARLAEMKMLLRDK